RMEATQLISNSILESDEEENENEKEQQFAKLCILKNNHIPETDLPLFLGDNVLGRDPSICTLPLSAASVSKQHATICISAYRRRGSNSKVDIEALVWDLGSMNGTRKGRLKMTPNVRYALSDGDSLLVADIPCQYHACGADSISRNLAVKERLPGALERKEGDASSKKSVSGGVKAVVSSLTTPARTTCLSFEQTPTQPQGTLVPESESDSDGERGVDRRHKELVSSSGSHKSSPTCSTFTSPTNKIVPESAIPVQEDVLSVSTTAVTRDLIPEFNMNSDTDMEGEEEGEASVGSLNLNTKQVDQPPNSAQFHMDSDTDVDENEDTIDKAHKTVPSSDDLTKIPQVNSVFHDTDVDDDDAATSQIADSAPVMQPNDFHLDSDTDVDEEEDMECQTNKPSSKMDETSPRLDIKPVEHDSAPAAPHRLHLDSDTDDEAVPAPAPCEPGAVSAAPDSCTTTSGGVDVLCDSDTDVDDNCPVVKPAVVRTSSVSPGTTSEALESVSNADTDVDGSSMPPVGDRANPPDLEGESNRDEEDQETAECQIASLSAVGGHAMLSSCSDSQDEDFVVAETQSFILQTRDGQSNPPEDHTMEPTQAFALEPTDNESDEQSSRERSLQLGLSDSSHLECQAQVLATENTQAFIPVDQSVNMEEAHTHSAVSSVYRTSAEINLNMVAAQLYGMNEEPARCSAMSIKDQVDLALEQTQTYTSEPHSVSEKETDEDERENMIADAETQPLGFPMVITLAMAETQPLSGFEGEESLAVDEPVSGMRQASSISQNETRMKASHEAAAQPQERPHDDLLCLPETQLMNMCEDEESNNEDAILVEQAQLPMSYNLPIVDTQPMARSENEESDDGDLIPVFRRRAKPLQIEDETQRLSSPEVSATETKPSGECKGGQSDEEDLPPRPRNRKARRLQIEEEQTQPVAIETQPIVTSEEEERNNENLIPGPPSAVDTKSLETQTAEQPERQREGESEAGTHGVSVRNKRGTRATFREAEEQAECSEPPKTQTRGNNKALTTTRGRRGKSRPDEDESEEELVEQVRRARGKRSLRQRKHKEEGEQFKMEKGECAENNSLIKEKQEGELEEERNVAGVRHHSEEMENKKGKVGRKHRGEEDDKLELERKEKEEQERLQAENTERIRLEQERIEKERKEFEEKERLEHQRAEQAEKERIEKERLDKEKQELEERLEKERKEEARLQREADEREERERLQKEKENREKQVKGQQKIKVVNDPKVTIRGRKAARRTVTALCTTEPQQDLTLSTNDDFPAKRTRSRSNSSNSVSSERSASSLTPQEARGRSGGRGNTSSSKPPQATTTGSRGRRRTVAAKTPEQDSRDISPQEVRSRSNSSNSLNSDISSCSINSQNRGRGNRQQGRLRKTEPGTISIPTFSNQSDLNSTPKPAARGRKSRKIEGSSQVVRQEDEEKADSQPAVATRGQQRETEPSAANEDKPNQEEGAAHEDSPLPKRIATGRRQKVLFTGLVDEEGERVLARLRGSMAKGVADMNCLVTDKVRRTVKFLCAVAKGIPIVTTQWLEKSGKAGSFLSPNAYVVKDSEQEKKFGFCLKESLSTASSQPLLQGYEIHVTKSVKPEPAQMKDIISCSGATFLPKMPSSPKPQTVVISCEEDWLLCGPAVSVALPVVTAEFILTGILQQKVDFQTHALSLPITNLQLAGRGKGRKKP
uniref:Mediator of DNA damage checkpoint protein 1 n=1 Tax=Echeneis naucrates TaxID=173247 RepID=A0A665VTD5_ECHNA